MPSSPTAPTTAGPAEDAQLTPEEETVFQEGAERWDAERRRALREPGLSWREWVLYTFAKWWIGLGCLIVDTWVVSSWIGGASFATVNVLGACLSLVAAIYLEILLFRYLWRNPAPLSEGRRFHRSWTALREVGRWTPESLRDRSTPRPVAAEDGTPNPREFL